MVSTAPGHRRHQLAPKSAPPTGWPGGAWQPTVGSRSRRRQAPPARPPAPTCVALRGSAARRAAAAVLAGLALALLGAGSPAPARAAELVADLDPRTVAVSSAPVGFASTGAVAYFSANDDRSGTELWVTNGDPAGTRMVGDFSPGRAGSYPDRVVPFGERFLFSVNDPRYGRELWVGDGPEGPFARLTDLCPGTCSGLLGQPLVVGDRAYFTGYTGYGPGEGSEPWVTDGTVAGTLRLAVTCPESCSTAHVFAAIGEHVVFTAAYDEIWRTDGTPAGTVRLATPPRCCAWVDDFVPFAGALFFAATDPTYKLGRELWVTDGTHVALAAEYAPGAASSIPQPYFAFAGSLWLATSHGCPPQSAVSGVCLWREDGDPSTPLQVVPETVGGLRAWAINGDVLYFIDQAQGPDRLWGLRAGDPAATLLWTLGEPTIPVSQGPFEMTAFRDGVAFSVGARGEVWFANLPPSDLPVLPTLYELTAGQADLDEVQHLTTTSFGLVWRGSRLGDRELWASDGTVAGTREIPLARNQASSDPQALAIAGNTLVFTAFDDQPPEGLRATFAVAGPPFAVTPIDSLVITEVAQLGTTLLVAGFERQGRQGLWRREGDGFVLISELSLPRHLLVAPDASGEDHLWFTTSPLAGEPLWLSDGTPEGTRQVFDPHPDYAPWSDVIGIPLPPEYYPRHLTRLGHGIALVAFDPTTATLELWFADGTAAGSSRIASFGTEDWILATTSLGDQALVQVARQGGGDLLAVAPGVAPRTLVSGVRPWEYLPWPVAVLGQEAFFFAPAPASDPSHAADPAPRADANTTVPATTPTPAEVLWRTDGSTAGTFPIKGFAIPAARGQELVAVGSRLLFIVDGAYTPRTLWSSDGSPAGTRTIALAGGSMANPSGLTTTPAGVALFAAWDAEAGVEPWSSDGTPAATERLGDLLAGPESSSPGPFVGGREAAYFPAHDGLHGRELWAVELADLPRSTSCVADAQTICLRGGRYGVSATFRNQRDPAAPARPASARALSAESGAFWFFRPDNLELMVKILDGSAINAHHWLFVSSLSDLDVELTVRDFASDATANWVTVPGSLCGLADLDAFPSPDATNATASGEPATTPPLVAAMARPQLASSTSCVGSTGAPCVVVGDLGLALSWSNPRSGSSGVGTPTPLTAATAGFSFFAGSNLEVLAKVLDGRSINGQRWLFHGAMTDLAYRIEVFDPQTGSLLGIVERPAGSLCGGAVIDRF